MRAAPILTFFATLLLGTAALAQSLQSGALSQDAANLTEAAPQISSPHDRRVAQDQLGTEPRAIQQVSQVANTSRTAQGPEPISKVSEGRTTTVVRLDGHDRCDAALPPARRSKACVNILENRASEFGRADSRELSPEQRLSLTRQIQAAGDDVVGATRRLAKTGDASESVEGMGVASVVLEGNKPPAPTDKPQDARIDPQTQAIIDAIVTPH